MKKKRWKCCTFHNEFQFHSNDYTFLSLFMWAWKCALKTKWKKEFPLKLLQIAFGYFVMFFEWLWNTSSCTHTYSLYECYDNNRKKIVFVFTLFAIIFLNWMVDRVFIHHLAYEIVFNTCRMCHYQLYFYHDCRLS